VLTQHDVNEVIFQFLMQNHFHFKEATRKYREQKENLLLTEDPSFHDEIEKQYEDIVKQLLVDEVTKQFAFPVESVIISLEGVNISAYV